MSDNSDNKVVALVSEGDESIDNEASSVVSLPGVLSEDAATISEEDISTSGQETMDLTMFMDMMQNKKRKRKVLPDNIVDTGSDKKNDRGKKTKGKKQKSRAEDSKVKTKNIRAKVTMSPPEDVQLEEVDNGDTDTEIVPLHTGRSFKNIVTLLAVVIVSLLLFGTVLHFADRQASVLSSPKSGPEGIVPITTPADEEILLRILGKEE